MATSYRRCRYLLPAALEEAVTAQLWADGILGLEQRERPGGQLEVDAFVDLETSPPQAPAGAEFLGSEELPADDWMAAYRRHVQPLEIGERFRIDPREPDESATQEPSDGRILLRLPAREAFGTGSHESTRLALELMEGLAFDGRRFLDVGTGSGILAFAALRLGARTAVGFDVDPVAILHAGQFRALNPGPEPTLFAGDLAVIAPGAGFDVALINILPENFLPHLPLLPSRLRRGGEAVFSGILATRGAEISDRLEDVGFRVEQERQAGEWVGFRCLLG